MEKSTQQEWKKVHSRNVERFTAWTEKGTQNEWRKVHSMNGEKYTA